MKRRISFGRERLLANFTFVTCRFLAVNDNVLFAGFAPCRAVQMRAELCLRVHWFLLGSGKHKNAIGPLFFGPHPPFLESYRSIKLAVKYRSTLQGYNLPARTPLEQCQNPDSQQGFQPYRDYLTLEYKFRIRFTRREQ